MVSGNPQKCKQVWHCPSRDVQSRAIRFSFSFKDVYSIKNSLHLFHLAELTSRDIACKDIVVIDVEVVKKKKNVKLNPLPGSCELSLFSDNLRCTDLNTIFRWAFLFCFVCWFSWLDSLCSLHECSRIYIEYPRVLFFSVKVK